MGSKLRCCPFRMKNGSYCSSLLREIRGSQKCLYRIEKGVDIIHVRGIVELSAIELDVDKAVQRKLIHMIGYRRSRYIQQLRKLKPIAGACAEAMQNVHSVIIGKCLKACDESAAFAPVAQQCSNIIYTCPYEYIRSNIVHGMHGD